MDGIKIWAVWISHVTADCLFVFCFCFFVFWLDIPYRCMLNNVMYVVRHYLTYR